MVETGNVLYTCFGSANLSPHPTACVYVTTDHPFMRARKGINHFAQEPWVALLISKKTAICFPISQKLQDSPLQTADQLTKVEDIA